MEDELRERGAISRKQGRREKGSQGVKKDRKDREEGPQGGRRNH